MQELTDRSLDYSPRASQSRTLRQRVYEIIETGHGESWASRIFDGFIVVLILLNVAAFVAETVPKLRAAWSQEFYYFERFSVAIFTIEYLLRLWTAVEVPYLSRTSPWRARLKLARQPALLIDLFAILPFYLSGLFAIDLRILRTLRLLRFLKLSRYSPAMYTLIRVLSNERRALLGAGLLLAAALLFSSTLMYYVEGDAQPDKFGSVPDAAWWAIATLTTVGYGDAAPVTALGKVIGGITMITGLCILALPVAIISTGFAQELQRRDFVVTWSLMSRVPLLARLDAKEAAEIMPLLQAHNLPPNFEVVRKGAPGDAVYFIASGKLETRTDDGERVYGAGDVFGVAAMFDESLHRDAVITSSKCRLLKLQRDDFYRLASRQPHIASRIRNLATNFRDDT
ncbi:cyclic nucleotide-gated ion channel [Hyphomicrobium sp. 99]|uniref:cyclic nucleotide-gated ion channel n=1 Tax=Hyphomicrobium sp. 99 TaxID=1163419 RepID=UPI0005F86658|nr:cyclic nucleotide-gated ion channel [Hyphomicrobium sp. 99]